MIGFRRFKRVWEVQGFNADDTCVFYSDVPYFRLRQARRTALAVAGAPDVQRVRVVDGSKRGSTRDPVRSTFAVRADREEWLR